MGYRVVRQPRAWWPVTFPGVTEEGKIVTNRFEGQFNLLKVDAAADWIAKVLEARKVENGKGTDLAALYASLVCVVLNNWREVEAENGDAMAYDGDKWLEAVVEAEAEAARKKAEAEAAGLEFVPVATIPQPKSGGDNLRMLMNDQGMFMHIFDAFRACINAKAEIREGN